MHVCTHTHKHRQTNTETHMETDRQTQIQDIFSDIPNLQITVLENDRYGFSTDIR